RPEAAQGMFVEFKRVFNIMREQLPLGIAQIGKTLRNEISPRKGVTRLREFTIMEVEVLLDPEKMDDCPNFNKYRDEKIKLLTAEMQENKKDPIIITLQDALNKGYIINTWMAYFLGVSKNFIAKLGIPEDKQLFREQLPHEKAHYSKQTIDLQVFLESQGWAEIAGHAYRTDWDLKRHMEFSGVDMRAFRRYEKPRKVKLVKVIPNKSLIGPKYKKDSGKIISKLSTMDGELVRKTLSEKGYVEVLGYKLGPEYLQLKEVEEVINGEKFIPHVIEPSYGADRLVYSALEYAYSESEGRVVLKLPIELAPIQIMVYPLLERDGLPELSEEIFNELQSHGFRVDIDHSGSIGRRYARADEIGVPLGITVDYQSLEDRTVTVRDRDTWKQRRCKINDLVNLLNKYFQKRIKFSEMGEPIN
ncbi:MAG: glycine--tRNA ligase, partial [Candidatus Odinarchaeia archaeon]